MPLFRRKLSLLEKMMVQHAHPVHLALATIGGLWGVYFLWHGNIPLAAAFGLGFPLIAHAAVWGHGEDDLAETAFGKMMLVHSNPANLFFHAVGGVVLVAGIYGHATEMILWGLSIVAFGHAFGWGKHAKHL